MSELPGPKNYPVVGMLPNFLPGGNLYNLSLIEMHRKCRDLYGPIVSFPGMLGSPPLVIAFIGYISSSCNSIFY